jgi:thiamine biosynthesis lipoprotein
MTVAAATQDTWRVFGTTAVLLVTVPDALEQARRLADSQLAAIDLACSRFRRDSELTALNTADGAARTVSVVFADLIAAALRAARLTDGDVDPTCGQALVDLGYDRDFALVQAASLDQPRPADTATASTGLASTGPASTGLASTGLASTGPANTGPADASLADTPRADTRPSGKADRVAGWRSVELDPAILRVRLMRGAQLDLGATAKAWAADRCAELIAAELGCGVLVSLGGDISVAGPPPADGWRVRVTDDHAAAPDAPGQTVTITEGGLATSSTTVRTWTTRGHQVHHIIDPATGESARSPWRTVSVAAGNCVDANTASTAAIIRGGAALQWLRDSGLPARLVRTDGTVETTAGWPSDAESPAADSPTAESPAADSPAAESPTAEPHTADPPAAEPPTAEPPIAEPPTVQP